LSTGKTSVVDEKEETQPQVTTTQVTTTAQSVETEEQQPDNTEIYTVVEKMPQFHGGEQALLNFIKQNLKYPKEAQKKGGQGTIIIRFTVDSKGKVADPIFLKSTVSENNKEIESSNQDVVELLNNEALRVINSLPDFIPGEQNGKKVPVYYTLPIMFKLDGNPDKTVTENWRKSLVIIVDGIQQPIGFDFKSIKSETIEKVDVKKPDTEEQKAELIAKYGENAANGVIEITKKK